MKTLLTLAVASGVALFRGYVLSHLWGWFVVPLGVHALGVLPAVGLMVMVDYLLGNVSRKAEDVLDVLATPLVALLLGYIVHLFI